MILLKHFPGQNQRSPGSSGAKKSTDLCQKGIFTCMKLTVSIELI